MSFRAELPDCAFARGKIANCGVVAVDVAVERPAGRRLEAPELLGGGGGDVFERGQPRVAPGVIRRRRPSEPRLRRFIIIKFRLSYTMWVPFASSGATLCPRGRSWALRASSRAVGDTFFGSPR